jgi:hypothetical protein
VILAMSRPDAKKNITTLVKAYGRYGNRDEAMPISLLRVCTLCLMCLVYITSQLLLSSLGCWHMLWVRTYINSNTQSRRGRQAGKLAL